MTDHRIAGDSVPRVAADAAIQTADTPESDRFETMFRDHFGFVWAVLARLGVDPAAVDDAAQDVFVVAHRNLPTFEGRSSDRTWLYGIARRMAYRYRRGQARRQKRKQALAHMLDASPGQSQEQILESRAALRLLDRCLHGLEPGQREAFVLSELHGLSGPELAAATGVPLNTAYSRLRLARRRVQGRLSKLHERGRCPAPGHVLQCAAEANAPPPTSRAGAWAALTTKLAATSPARLATFTTAGKWLTGALGSTPMIAGGAVAATALVAVVATSEPAAPPPRAAPTVVQTEPTANGSAAPPRARRTQPAAPPAQAPAEAPEPVVPTDVAPAEPASPSSPQRTRAGSTDPEPPPAAAAEPLAEEQRLVTRARRALQRRQHDRALALLDEHARRFPRGVLAVERAAERIVVLCASGRRAQGRGEASAFKRAHPTSKHLPRIDAACG